MYKRNEYFSLCWETLTKSRFLLCSIPLEWVQSEWAWSNFLQMVSAYVLWTHQAWERGYVPERAFDGSAYSGLNNNLAGRRLSHTAMLVGFKADCKGRNEMHLFRTSYRSKCICDRCPATAYNTRPEELCFIDFEGPHRQAKVTQREFLRETRSLWSRIPGQPPKVLVPKALANLRLQKFELSGSEPLLFQ